MRIIFMGTPALAVPCLDALREEHEIVLVVTQPDKPARRGHEMSASPVKERAMALGLPIAQPERARNGEFVAHLATFAPDGIAVVAYGQILPRAILDMAPRGCINLHYSLLPRWRGAAPVQHAILAGDVQTGVTTQWMAEKLDAGDILLQRPVDILPGETTCDLWERLTPIGAELLRESFRLIENATAPRIPQDESGISIARSLDKDAGRIHWNEPAAAIVNRVRAMNPWPVAFCAWEGQPLKIYRAQVSETNTSAASAVPGTILAGRADAIEVAAGNGAVRLIEVQAPGRARLDAVQWARGARLVEGARLE